MSKIPCTPTFFGGQKILVSLRWLPPPLQPCVSGSSGAYPLGKGNEACGVKYGGYLSNISSPWLVIIFLIVICEATVVHCLAHHAHVSILIKSCSAIGLSELWKWCSPLTLLGGLYGGVWVVAQGFWGGTRNRLEVIEDFRRFLGSELSQGVCTYVSVKFQSGGREGVRVWYAMRGW